VHNHKHKQCQRVSTHVIPARNLAPRR
jgi:hypothetical protein